MGQIYKITCIANSKIYIGSAVSSKERFRKHKEALNRGTHHNIYLQHAWDKYGTSQFVFEVIEEVKDNNLLITREQAWLDNTKAYNKSIGFNICEIASSQLGVKQSESACLKKSKTYTVTYPCGNEVIITNLNQFCKNNNLPQSNMIDVSRGINSQYKGWKCRPINLSKEEWMKIVTKNAKTKWYLIDPNGKEYWVRSKEFKQFCKEYGLSALSLQDVSSGKRDKIRGWSAKYIRSDYHNRSII